MSKNKQHLVDDKYLFKDLVDIERLRELFESFSLSTGYTIGLVSHPDQELLINTGWRDACMLFHRAVPDSRASCEESNRKLMSHLKNLKEHSIRHCENGLVDGATPVIIKGAHVANLATGQIFFQEPELERFREQAEAYEYDLEAYLKAIKEIPIVTEEAFRNTLSFLSGLAVMLAEQGLAEIQLRESSQTVLKEETYLRTLIETIPDLVWMKDPDGVYLSCNRKFEKFFGAKEAEIVGKTDYDFVDIKLADFFRKNDKAAMAANEPSINEEEITFADDGHRELLETIKTPIHDSENRLIGVLGIARNITRHKETLKALRKSEEQYRLLIETMNDGFAIQENQVLTYANNSFCSMLGYTIDELIGKNINILFDKKNQKKLKNELAKRAKGTAEPYEIEMIKKDGETVHIIISPSTMSFDGKIFHGSSATFTDITSRIRAEEILRRSENEYRTTMENLSIGVLVHAKDTRILLNNKKAADILGFKGKQMLGKGAIDPAWDFVHDDETPMKVKDYPVSKVISTGKPLKNYLVGVSRPERDYTTWLTVNATPLFSDDGELEKVIVNFADITERKKAENELHHLRNYLSNIIDSMPSILIGIDSEGIVTQWNREAEVATGISVADAVGQSLETSFPRLYSEMKRVRSAIDEGREQTDSKRPRQEEGETIYEDITIYPLISNGSEGAVIRIDDVTEQVRLEEMMVQSEKMLSVGGLAAGMAHEINNPLAGLMQAAENMSRRLTKIDHPANLKSAEEAGTNMKAINTFMENRGILRMLQSISEAGIRISGIVENMLSFARKSDSSVSSHDIEDLLDKTLELAATDYDLKGQYDFKTIEITRDYEKDLPPVPCEGAKIQQVFLNIFRNGAQAMSEHRAECNARGIKCEPPRFILRIYKESIPAMCCIEIEDNGPGIDEKTRKRIFEPFFTTKQVGMGTGLGLSVSYFIISENHGGTMNVQSKPGRGARFIIRLPFERIDRL